MSNIAFQNPWAVGQRVRMVRLSKRDDLNGQYAVISSPFDSENGRFRVNVEKTKEQINVKSVNLEATKAITQEHKNHIDDGLMWEYKWKEDSKEIHGPYVVFERIVLECIQITHSLIYSHFNNYTHVRGPL